MVKTDPQTIFIIVLLGALAYFIFMSSGTLTELPLPGEGVVPLGLLFTSKKIKKEVEQWQQLM